MVCTYVALYFKFVFVTVEPPKPINMFGGPPAKENNTGGFSFNTKLSAPSSFFSMFK